MWGGCRVCKRYLYSRIEEGQSQRRQPNKPETEREVERQENTAIRTDGTLGRYPWPDQESNVVLKVSSEKARDIHLEMDQILRLYFFFAIVDFCLTQKDLSKVKRALHTPYFPAWLDVIDDHGVKGCQNCNALSKLERGQCQTLPWPASAATSKTITVRSLLHQTAIFFHFVPSSFIKASAGETAHNKGKCKPLSTQWLNNHKDFTLTQGPVILKEVCW